MAQAQHNPVNMCLLSKIIATVKADPLGAVIGAVVALACLSALIEFWLWIGGVR